jgi:hypothetical protein
MISRPDQNKDATFSIVQQVWTTVCGPQPGGGISCVPKLLLSQITKMTAGGGDARPDGFRVQPDGTFG